MQYNYTVNDKGYNYTVNDKGTLTIFTADNMSIADISECGNMTPIDLENLVTEVLIDMGYEV